MSKISTSTSSAELSRIKFSVSKPVLDTIFYGKQLELTFNLENKSKAIHAFVTD